MRAHKYRLLYVEDQLDEEPYLAVPFEEEGFDVVGVTTGLQAVTCLAREAFDAVVLDNMLAGGGEIGSEWGHDKTENGLRTGSLVLATIEAMALPPPVWVLTALADTDTEKREKTSDVVEEYIKKEFSLIELAQKIKRRLDERGGKDGEYRS